MVSDTTPCPPTAVFFPLDFLCSLCSGEYPLLIRSSLTGLVRSPCVWTWSQPSLGHNEIYALSLCDQKLASICCLPSLNPQLTRTTSQELCISCRSLSPYRP